jgi:hypothetical protein
LQYTYQHPFKKGKTELAKAKFAQARELDANVVFGDKGLK